MRGPSIKSIIRYMMDVDPRVSELTPVEFLHRFEEAARTHFGVESARWQPKSIQRARSAMQQQKGAGTDGDSTHWLQRIVVGLTFTALVVAVGQLLLAGFPEQRLFCFGLTLDASLGAWMIYRIVFWRYQPHPLPAFKRLAILGILAMSCLLFVGGVAVTLLRSPQAPNETASKPSDGEARGQDELSRKSGRDDRQAEGLTSADSPVTHITYNVYMVPEAGNASTSRPADTPGSATNSQSTSESVRTGSSATSPDRVLENKRGDSPKWDDRNCDGTEGIQYRGKLMQPSGVPVSDGLYSIRFAIYSVPTGGKPLWFEHNDRVQVRRGLFDVLLTGIPEAVLCKRQLWFAVRVGDDPEMVPRQQVTDIGSASGARDRRQ